MNKDLFGYSVTIKLFGVIPIYEKFYVENVVMPKKNAVLQVSDQPSPKSAELDSRQTNNDFWS